MKKNFLRQYLKRLREYSCRGFVKKLTKDTLEFEKETINKLRPTSAADLHALHLARTCVRRASASAK